MNKKIWWTPSTYECFENKCVCSDKCSNYAICQELAKESKDKLPPIKKVVDELRTVGVAIPIAVTDSAFNDLSDQAIDIIKCWVNNLTDEQTAKTLKSSLAGIQSIKKQLMVKFSYALPDIRNYKKSDVFRLWAKAKVIPELDRLRKEGVQC